MTDSTTPADPFRSGPPPGASDAGPTSPPPPADYPAPPATGYGPPAGYGPPPGSSTAADYPPPPGGYAAPPPPAGYPSAEPTQGWPAPGGAAGPAWGGAGGAPGAATFDPKTVDPMDWGIIAAGVLAFIFSTFSYYTVSVKVTGIGSSTGSESAWHGFFGWFAALLALAGAAVLALEFFAPQVKLPFPGRLLTAGLFAVATLSVLLALVVVPIATSFAGIDIDKGHGIGYWLSLLVIVVGLALSVSRLQATGGSLPWEKPKTTT